MVCYVVSIGMKRKRQKKLIFFISTVLILICLYLIAKKEDIMKYKQVYGNKTGLVSKVHTFSPLDNQLCHGKGIQPLGKTTVIKCLDFFKKESLRFLDNYKNPCFYRNVTYLNGKVLKKPVLSFRCVPYFFVIGMPKSGTTDVWHGLEQHPGVAIKHLKEPMYFNRRRYPVANWSLDQYLDYFHAASELIRQTPSPDKWIKDQLFYYLVTGEGTVDISHDNNRWREIPGNEDCNEPRIMNSHYLYHLNPKMKLIFMMRNPIDRVFSDYLYESQFFGYKKTVEDFHVAVLESIANHMTCRKYFTRRGCAYNSSLESFKGRLRVGMYYLFLDDWYRVFPKEQIMVIQFEEFIADRIGFMRKIFAFLDLRPLTVTEEIKQRRRHIPNTRSMADREIGDMLYPTRKLLSKFYAPFNRRLSQLLGDNKYLWES